jgi:hypothetical protein
MHAAISSSSLTSEERVIRPSHELARSDTAHQCRQRAVPTLCHGQVGVCCGYDGWSCNTPYNVYRPLPPSSRPAIERKQKGPHSKASNKYSIDAILDRPWLGNGLLRVAGFGGMRRSRIRSAISRVKRGQGGQAQCWRLGKNCLFCL